ncbi:MAG: dihydrodipicolinate synthase family protein [Acidobacteria bacterium]|nr:dihydrodipicolinate synthase family protein [Acidobacteriota bacterium]
MNNITGGVLPALLTPMDQDGQLLPSALEKLCAALYTTPIDGLYVCGQTGEGLQQPLDQRKRVVEVAVQSTPSGKHVMAHIGAMSTQSAIELARHAEKAGAHSISSLPPSGSYSIEEVHSYYSAIAASTALPLFIYFFPGFAARPSGFDDLRRLCEIKGVAGLKFTSTDLFTMWKLKREGAVIFNGFDEILVAGLSMGADGGIGTFYNVVPEWFAGIYDCSRTGNWNEARALQAKVNDVIELGLKFPAHAATKAMLAWQGVECGYCRPPRTAALTEDQLRVLHGELERLGIPKR